MKVATLYSGGKDSNYALYLASKEYEVSCLISMRSINPQSYMFQSVGNEIIKLQSKSLGIPIIFQETSGEKEKELEDLKKAILDAKKKFKIEGIVTGAIQSAYQSSRIQKICYELDLYCFNPLWQIDEEEYIKELVENKFEIIIASIAAYPLNENFIGEKIDNKFIRKIRKFQDISIIGEGGEYESLVLDSPMFKKRIKIEYEKVMDQENSGNMIIKKAILIKK